MGQCLALTQTYDFSKIILIQLIFSDMHGTSCPKSNDFQHKWKIVYKYENQECTLQEKNNQSKIYFYTLSSHRPQKVCYR